MNWSKQAFVVTYTITCDSAGKYVKKIVCDTLNHVTGVRLPSQLYLLRKAKSTLFDWMAIMKHIYFIFDL